MFCRSVCFADVVRAANAENIARPALICSLRSSKGQTVHEALHGHSDEPHMQFAARTFVNVVPLDLAVTLLCEHVPDGGKVAAGIITDTKEYIHWVILFLDVALVLLGFANGVCTVERRFPYVDEKVLPPELQRNIAPRKVATGGIRKMSRY